MAWTDERLDDLARRTDVGFDHLRTDIRDLRQETSALRTEMHEGFGQLRSEMHEGLGQVRSEMHDGFGQLRSEMHEGLGQVRSEMHEGLGQVRSEVNEQIRELRAMVVRVGGGLIVGFAGVIATVAVGGV